MMDIVRNLGLFIINFNNRILFEYNVNIIDDNDRDEQNKNEISKIFITIVDEI
jgi:hypothetical protein